MLKKRMLKKCGMFLVVICIFITGSSCSFPGREVSHKPTKLTVSAASSLQPVLSDLEAIYEGKQKNTDLSFNFGASGSLKTQIAQGAPVDLFLSASSEEMDMLIKNGLIEKKDTDAFLENSLVLIKNKSLNTPVAGFKDLIQSGIKRISIGSPDIVPAGKYAKETLDTLHLWPKVKDKMVYGKDVRQVLTYVETGNVEAGIVYKTDALTSKKSTIVSEADVHTHSAISYNFGVIKSSKHSKAALEFLHFLTSKEAIKVFKTYGYKIRGGE